MTKKIECYKIKTGEDTGGNPIYTMRCFCNTTTCMQQNKKEIIHTDFYNSDVDEDILREINNSIYKNFL